MIWIFIGCCLEVQLRSTTSLLDNVRSLDKPAMDIVQNLFAEYILNKTRIKFV